MRSLARVRRLARPARRARRCAGTRARCPGPFRRSFWRSPIRGPWLTSVLGLVLLAGVSVVFVTGLLSYAAYNPDLNRINDTDPRQGPARLLPVLLAHPPGVAVPAQPGRARHPGAGAHPDPAGQAVVGAAEAVRVAAAAQSRARAGAAVAAAARGRGGVRVRHRSPQHPAVVQVPRLVLHPALLRRLGVRGRPRGTRGPEEPDRDQGAAQPRPDPGAAHRYRPHASRNRRTASELVSPAPAAPTISRRGALAFAGAGSLLLLARTVGQSLGGPLRRTALLAPHGQDLGTGPNDFQINQTAAAGGHQRGRDRRELAAHP